MFLSNFKDDFCWEMIIGVDQQFLNLYNNQKHPKRTRAGGKFVHLHFGSSLERNKQLELTWTESTFEGSQKYIFDVREMFLVRFFLLPYISPKGGHSSYMIIRKPLRNQKMALWESKDSLLLLYFFLPLYTLPVVLSSCATWGSRRWQSLGSKRVGRMDTLSVYLGYLEDHPLNPGCSIGILVMIYHPYITG